MGASVAETEELRESLRRALAAYRRERPNLSLRAISKNSGVNRYFLMKLLDDKGDATSLDLKQVLLLAKFVTERGSNREYEDNSTVEVRKAIQKAFNLDLSAATERLQKLPVDDFIDIYQYLVLTLARHQRGTSRTQIANILGSRGSHVCLDYLKAGVIKEINGRLLFSEKYLLEEKDGLTLQRLPELIRFFKLRPKFVDSNHMHLVTESISPEALKKIQKLYANVHKKVMTLIKDGENQGNIPFFALACVDSFEDVEDK